MSKYLPAVKPWEWGEVPVFWVRATLAAMSAEHRATEHFRDKSERKATRAQGRQKKGI